jgi:putative ABC transport system permease protein
MSADEQQRVEEAVRGITRDASVHVERGFTETLTTPFLALALVGALLVLVGTLTAAGLALVDAGPDLATLGAVGAAPRTRRGIAAGQVLVIGLLGATLGVAAGTIPGLAAAWQITAGPDGQHPTLAVPWTLLALVALATPGIAALCSALATRSRPQLTRRLAG